MMSPKLAGRSVSSVELGFRFFLGLAGVVLAVGIAVGLGLLLFTRAVYAWGFLGAFAALAAVLIASGWLYDRREARARDGY